jgi:hypothetical protein
MLVSFCQTIANRMAPFHLHPIKESGRVRDKYFKQSISDSGKYDRFRSYSHHSQKSFSHFMYIKKQGHALAQAINLWLPTMAARVHVGFMVDKVTMRQVSSKYFRSINQFSRINLTMSRGARCQASVMFNKL